jgi:hypothetical protein
MFNISRDISLLKCALQHNPWQLGKERWTQIVSEINKTLDCDISERTARDRVALLVKKYEEQSLTKK